MPEGGRSFFVDKTIIKTYYLLDGNRYKREDTDMPGWQTVAFSQALKNLNRARVEIAVAYFNCTGMLWWTKYKFVTSVFIAKTHDPRTELATLEVALDGKPKCYTSNVVAVWASNGRPLFMGSVGQLRSRIDSLSLDKFAQAG